jgi:hypothetical protein
MSTSIVATGIRTGSIETRRSVRNGLAFDLSALGPDHIIVAAELRVRHAARVVVNDPSARVCYGRSQEDSADREAIRLNPAALEDLHQARGAYFWIEARVMAERGLAPHSNESPCTLDLTLARCQTGARSDRYGAVA